VSIRVLLADDQAMVRAGFRLILDAEPDIEVIAEAADGTQAIALAQQLRPDVCLVDIRMPAPDGLEVTRRITGDGTSSTAVVIVTTFDLDEYVDQALQHGASGFVLKDAGPALLIEAVRAAVSGDALISPGVTNRLLDRLARHRRPAPPEPLVPLTPREEDVLLAVAGGLTNTEIGDRLHLSLSTVKTHLSAIQTKIGARNRVEVAAFAHTTGRVPEATD